MAKAAKFKKLRKLATQMPAINHLQKIGERVNGKYLLEHGIKEVDGNPVNEKGMYKGIKKVAVPLNHYQKMKMLYNKHGVNGVNSYLSQVKNFVQQKANA